MLVGVAQVKQVTDLIRRERSGGVSAREIILVFKQNELQIPKSRISKRELVASLLFPTKETELVPVVMRYEAQVTVFAFGRTGVTHG